jgi:putative ABC transport system ATP-binding protein
MILKPDINTKGQFLFKCSKTDNLINDMILFWNENEENKILEIRKKCIGYVIQTGGLLPFFSVFQNIELVCRLNGLPTKDNRIENIARILGLNKLLLKKPKELSGGERQRTAIARAIIHKPAVVLADEPTGSVDSDRGKTIINEFKNLALKNQTCVIIATHNLKLVKDITDSIYTFHLENFGSSSGQNTTVSTLQIKKN